MNLNQEQQEKLTLAIQAAIGVLVIGLSVRNSAQIQTAEMKKLAKKDVKHQARLQKNEYAMKNKLLKQKYQAKLQRAKKSGKRSPLLTVRRSPLSGKAAFFTRTKPLSGKTAFFARTKPLSDIAAFFARR